MKKQIIENINVDPRVKIVITDVRFPNEIEMLKQFGGTIVKVVRNKIQLDNHMSELSIDNLNADIIIFNSGTKDELYQAITQMLGLY